MIPAKERGKKAIGSVPLLPVVVEYCLIPINKNERMNE